jgi:hypothetical protein
MNREELLSQLSQDILTYVMHGTFPERHVAEKIKPTGLDERFDDYEKLINLHFILRQDIVRFVENLPQRIRNIKTQTENVSQVNRGTVNGRINWSSTVQERYTTNPHNRALFVCDNRSEDYDIGENIVLKQLLSTIYTTLRESEEYLQRDYEWVSDRWKEGNDLVATMRRIFERNIHVTRIRDPEEYEPTERMLQRASESRSEIYRLAATHIRKHRESIAGDADAIRELLDQTAITPDDEETLFELFVLFRFVSSIESMSDQEFKLRTIETDSQEIGRLNWEGETEIVLYHDNSARERNLSFITEAFEKPESELTRTELVQRESRAVANQYFDGPDFERRTGRPDVIVLEVRGDSECEYLITEVKYSNRPETIRSGIKETLEYLAFLRKDGDYVYQDGDAFGSGWNGVLVTQDMENTEAKPLSEQRSIKILQASEVEEKIQSIFQTVIE